MQLKLHPLAEEDYKKAIDYYFNIDAKLEKKFISFLEQTFNKILKFPHIYPFETQTTQKVVMSTFPYVVLYEKYEDTIMILAIFHTKRHPQNLESRNR